MPFSITLQQPPNYWQIRTKCVLTLPLLGLTSNEDEQNHGKESVDLEVRVKSFTLTRNDHFTADTLMISAEWQDINIDPRYVKNGTIQFYAGLADADGNWQADDKNYRFIGIVKTVHRKSQEGGLAVEIEAHDYTSMFLAQKPYASDGYPTFNDTLQAAWIRICEHTGFWDNSTGKMISNVEALKNSIEARGGVNLSLTVGTEGLPQRIKEFGRVPHKSGDTAWDVWTRTCFCRGLITFIDKDKVVITTTTEHFSPTDAPSLIYGVNVIDCDEVCDTSVSNKGIGLVSYDVTTGKTIEAFYPRAGDTRINVKRGVARRKSYKPSDVLADQYDIYDWHDTQDPEVLELVAQRAYEERARQEIQGVVKTAEPVLYASSGELIEVMDMVSGDNLRVQIDPGSLELIKNEPPALATQRLIDMGYDPRVAYLLSKNLASMAVIDSSMHTRSVTTHYDGDSETFEVTFRYWNAIRSFGGDSVG